MERIRDLRESLLSSLLTEYSEGTAARIVSREGEVVPVKLIPTGATLGARIEGVDLTRDMDDATFDAVRRAFYQYEVVYFRGAKLCDEDQIRFSLSFLPNGALTAQRRDLIRR